MDFRTDGLLILRDNMGRYRYSLVDRNVDISFPERPKNVLRLRIGELTADKLTIAISGKRGDELDDKFSKELVELTYRPIDE